MKQLLIELHRQKKCLEMEIKTLEEQMNRLPNGHLRVAGSRGRKQFFHMEEKGDTKGKYISFKKEKDKILMLAQKDYYWAVLPHLKERLNTLEKCIWLCESIKLPKLYSNLHPIRKKLLSPNVYDDALYAKVWENISYQGKPFEKDTPEIYTEKGERVRSKSEKLIADKLLKMEIPYRYEYPLKLNGYGIIYPDFTILDIYSNKILYWEHFGKMDDPDYANKTIRKINLYYRNGFYLGDNLLVTFETSKAPIDMRDIERMLREKITI